MITRIYRAFYTRNACEVDIGRVPVYKRAVIPDPVYKQIGTIIKARRKALHLKQENLARTLEISRGALANIETGRQRILVHQLYDIADALDLKPADLLPPPITGDYGAERDALPLPADLNPRQKKQVALLISQTNINPRPSKEDNRAKNTTL